MKAPVGCTCTECPKCLTPTVCAECKACTRCAGHVAKDCPGCPAPNDVFPEISELEREMNLTALIGKLETVVEFDRVALALAARFDVVAKQLAKTMLPTFSVGDTVLVKCPDPSGIPLAGRIEKIGKTMNLHLRTAAGAVVVPVIRCTRVNHEAG